MLERGLAVAPADRYFDMPSLLAALHRAAAPRFKRRAGVAIAMVVIAGGAAWAHGRNEPDPCPAPALASWDPPHQSRVERAFLATGLPYAEQTWERTRRSLDKFADRWGAQSRDVCLAFDVNHTDDAALHARRATCLEQGRIELEAVVDRLGEAATGAALSAQATQLIDALPDLDACVRPDNFALPAEPASRATYLEFLTAIAGIRSFASAGRIDDAERELAAATRLVKDLGSKRAEATIAYVTGQLAELRRHNAAAIQAYESALWTAEATGYDELVAAAALELLHTLGGDARDADAQKYRELARAAAERIGSPTARARAARAIGQADLVAGRFDSAEHELSNALELARIPNDDYDVASVLTDLGDLYYRRGQSAKAEPLQRQAIELFARAVGPDHPAQGTAYNNLGNTLADLGRNDEAAAAYAKALAIRERALCPIIPRSRRP